MRMSLRTLLVLFLIVMPAAADEVVRLDGQVQQGRVLGVRVQGHGEIPREELLGVHLVGDRAAIDARWIEDLLRHALDRTRRGVAADGVVGVYLGRGAHPPSAMAVLRRLDEGRRAPRLLFEGDVTDTGLRGLKVLVVPGGWAPSQLAALGPVGQAALARFVERGGGYLGICAGGYLPCTEVVWEGVRWPYPLGLARGVATGPVVGRTPWPTAEALTLTLADGRKAAAIHAGGSTFDIEGATVLASYPGGANAAVEVHHGKGRLVLTGAHVELRERIDADLLARDGWATGLEPGDGALFDMLLTRLLKPRR